MKFCATKEKFDKCMSRPLIVGPPNIFKEDGLSLIQMRKQ